MEAKLKAFRVIAGILAMALLCGCSGILGPIKAAAGLSKAPPVPEIPLVSPHIEFPRDPYQEDDFPDYDIPPETDFPDYNPYAMPDDDDWSDFDDPYAIPGGDLPDYPDVLPYTQIPQITYNGYLGLTVTLPEECYTSEEWYAQLWDPAILTEQPEASMSPDLFQWEDDVDGYYLSMLDIDYYSADFDYGYYSLRLDYYPDMSEEEYIAYIETYFEEDTEYANYTVAGSDIVNVGGAEARHYVVEVHGVDEMEYAEIEEYFVIPVQDMHVIQYISYPQDSIEAMEISQRLAKEICSFTL